MTADLPENMPSPWWPCPECGGVEFRALVHFERGEWETDGADETYEVFEPPEGRPTAVGTSDVICETCSHRFNMHAHYGWPTTETEVGK